VELLLHSYPTGAREYAVQVPETQIPIAQTPASHGAKFASLQEDLVLEPDWWLESISDSPFPKPGKV
jgi:hypothetical protein